jgi:3-hydroxyisobutyrate dehydrogenase-like beta-hydroxyacid dehydrogenase
VVGARRVAVVGLGKMGSALARRLLGLGVEVTIWNRSAAAAEALAADGAHVASSLAQVWDGIDVVLTFLADDSAVRSVRIGESRLLAVAPGGGLLVEMSTISPAVSAELAEAALAAGIDYLRSPVSGNPGVLAAGQLTLIVSGDRAAFERGRELLGSVGAKVHYVGAGDEARTLKLAVNSVLASTAQALAEAIVLCEVSGIDRAVTLDVISSSAVGSPFVAYKRDALLARSYEATFTTTMVEKDLGLVAGAAESAGVVLPLADLVRRLAGAAARSEGFGDLDFMALLVHLQVLSGLPTDVPRGTAEP